MVTEREPHADEDYGPEVNPDSVNKMREFVQAMSKLIHGKQIYARNNPTLVKFTKDFHKAFRSFVDEHDEVVLTIEQNALRWEGELVYENNERDDSIAFLLYKDGIGEICIPSSASDSEVDRFIDIVKDELHGPATGAEDVVTRLWKADFDNITYRVLDEYLVGEFGEGRMGTGAEATPSPLEMEDHTDLPSLQDRGRVIVDTQRYAGSIESYLAQLLEKAHPDCAPEKREEAFQELVESLFNVSSDELRRCREELDAERQRDTLVDFLDSIFFFTQQENPSSFRDLCNIIDSIATYILNESEPTTLAQTLLAIRAFVGIHDLAEPVARYFQNLEDRFTDTAYMHGLGKAVDSWGAESVQLIAYYRQVGKRVVPAACALLEDVDDHKAHQAICDVLVDVASDDLEKIIEELDMDNPLIARDVACLLRQMSTKTIPPLAHELMFYPDLRVREEVIRFLADVNNEDAAVMLVRLLDHDDRSTRVKTLVAMEEVKSPIITNKLMAVAFDKELSDKTSDEQEHVFRTLGKCAGVRALPDIKRMLEKRSRFGFGKGQKQQDKVLAIRALEHIQAEESVRLLRELADDASAPIKVKAQRVLRALENAPKE
jgi:HEAT repeat protein